jgi:mono/diheme cytochrome c family protein
MRFIRNRIPSARGIVPALLLSALALVAQAAAQERPATVPDSQIQAGRKVFLGVGQCSRCHGSEGQGTDDGAPLISGTWKLGDGSYRWLTHIISHAGVSARGRDGDPQAMRGPALLAPEELRAVACYVWSISRGRAPRPKS